MPKPMHRAACIKVLMLLALIALAGEARAAETRKFVRFAADGMTGYGELAGDTIHILEGNFLTTTKRSGGTVPLSRAQLLAPLEPAKVIGVALNFETHGGTRGSGPPGYFAKLPSSIIGPGEAIVMPRDSRSLHYEGEMVVVIGRRAKNVALADAGAHVFGVTAGNDVTERSYPFSAFHVIRAKGSDTFGPLGPAVVTGLDHNNLTITTRVNGKTVQSDNTKNLIHDVEALIAHISKAITLEPGDVIYTGTPGSTSALKPGDRVEVTLEGVGTLSNNVEAPR